MGEETGSGPRRGRGGGEAAGAERVPPQQHRRPSGGFTCSAGRLPSSYALTGPPRPPPRFIFCLCPLCVPSLPVSSPQSASLCRPGGREGARALGAPRGGGRGRAGAGAAALTSEHVTTRNGGRPLPRRAPPLLTPRGSRASRARLRRRPLRIWRRRGRALRAPKPPGTGRLWPGGPGAEPVGVPPAVTAHARCDWPL